MSLPLVFQAGVRDEIDEAYTWYERQRRGLGEELLAEVQRALDRIERNPETHAPIYPDRQAQSSDAVSVCRVLPDRA